MKRLAFAVCLTCTFGLPALADIGSVRPQPRPPQSQPVAVQVSSNENLILPRSIRPQPRPKGFVEKVSAPPQGVIGKLFGGQERAVQKPKTYAAGGVCKDSAIEGTMITAIKSPQNGCGIDAPVRVTAVDGVKLSMPATLDCETARALRKWVTTKLKPAFGKTKVVGLDVAAHYACRGRNNVKGAKVSEHGRGKAIDIAGFKLENGTEVTVLNDYKSNRGKAIRSAHKGACGIFGTTLGPGSDGYHENHLHLDTAKYRGGPYCK
ncbi:extensin family protein [Pseudorhodobacter sp. W20_MBD10_FR17]|uniref:extensin-like domain-containing protein n=1 Tax=Pseudorhodobacter sp. W20_MBD10_FR17 TaxID=3240266 RepID=UPI003F9B5C5F